MSNSYTEAIIKYILLNYFKWQSSLTSGVISTSDLYKTEKRKKKKPVEEGEEKKEKKPVNASMGRYTAEDKMIMLADIKTALPKLRLRHRELLYYTLCMRYSMEEYGNIACVSNTAICKMQKTALKELKGILNGKE